MLLPKAIQSLVAFETSGVQFNRHFREAPTPNMIRYRFRAFPKESIELHPWFLPRPQLVPNVLYSVERNIQILLFPADHY